MFPVVEKKKRKMLDNPKDLLKLIPTDIEFKINTKVKFNEISTVTNIHSSA